jgi:SOS-response transcriptional repressor LexA
MRDARIFDEDMLIIARAIGAHTGHVAIAVIDNEFIR